MSSWGKKQNDQHLDAALRKIQMRLLEQRLRISAEKDPLFRVRTEVAATERGVPLPTWWHDPCPKCALRHDERDMLADCCPFREPTVAGCPWHATA